MIEEHTYSTDITARCNDKDRPSALAIKIFGDRGSHFHSYLNLSVCFFFFTAFFTSELKIVLQNLKLLSEQIAQRIAQIVCPS